MENTFFNAAMSVLRNYVDTRHNGNVSSAARALGIKGDSLYKWLRGDRKPGLEKLAPIFEALQVTLTLPGEPGPSARDVCFVDARVVPAGGRQSPPEAEDYMAVPLVEEVGAGPGIIPQGELKSWFLVYKHQKAVRYRRDLIAVEIGKTSTSMVPTLSPGDLVLVDRQDRDVTRPGHMMLVMDPEGAGKIKRVAVEEKQGDYRVTFYSDNTVNNPPEVYSLHEDFLDDWERCIVGRVVWAWSDVSEK